ncbi:hypothetical protein M885DRAFT_526191 [Pelagophyceae sp. CCMP2097]|nr:hypothetical protein M885DRAFT_526191 [Pelagophyceae sp. CCMP2097]
MAAPGAAEPHGAALPESVWSVALSFAELREVETSARCSKLLFDAASAPWLPCRLRLCVHGPISGLLQRCPLLKHAEGDVCAFDLSTSGAKHLETLAPRCQDAAPIALLLAAVAGGLFPKLRTLDVAATRHREAPQGSGGGMALNGLAMRMPWFATLGAGAPFLRSLRLTFVEPFASFHVDRLLQSCPVLQDIVLSGPFHFRVRRPRHFRENTRLNVLSHVRPPALRVRCGLCGAVIYANLKSYTVGPRTQRHISFEIYTDQTPTSSTDSPMGSPNAPRRLNCANACHAARDKFLVAERGGAINTLDFRWALACGEGLAVVSRLDAKRPGPESTARTDPDLEGFSEERRVGGGGLRGRARACADERVA